MPQSRHKTPFSGKAKKQQLKEKKQRKQHAEDIQDRVRSKNYLLTGRGGGGGGGEAGESGEEGEAGGEVLSLNKQPVLASTSKRNPNRYNLQFHRESREEIKARTEEARKTLRPLTEESLELSSEVEVYFPAGLDFPLRPPWDFSLSKAQLEAREQRYFTEYLKKIEENYRLSELSYFELNLETWRQLWRVLEMADIVLLIADIRFVGLLVPPSLCRYVREILGKELIVVLNKIDLAPPALVLAWKYYLKERYPGVQVIMFTSYPTYNLRNRGTTRTEGLDNKRRRGKMRMAAEGAQKLLDACKEIVRGQVDLSSWQEKISEELSVESELGEEEVEVTELLQMKSPDVGYHRHERFEKGVLTLGCVGQPNVGKSSLMNALMGRKVVSVSRTPGHTKHFQTIFLTKTVKLCDCPGLVFPSRVPKPLQILMGSFPIAQLREPYSTVQYLAERLDLVRVLHIQHPEGASETLWSAVDICDGWAAKKGYKTARAARLDTYRAANHILRLALEGRVSFCLRPPGYTANKEKWSSHPEVEVVRWIQAAGEEETTSKWERPQVGGPGGAAASPPPADSSGDEDTSSDRTEESAAAGASSIPSVLSSHSENDTDDDDENDDASQDGIGAVQAQNKFQVLNMTD